MGEAGPRDVGYGWVDELVGDGPEATSIKQELAARDAQLVFLGAELLEAQDHLRHVRLVMALGAPKVDHSRCPAQALIVEGQWKRCHRDIGHAPSEPHVWLESLDRIDGRPLLATWYEVRTMKPTISQVLVGS